MTDSTVGEAEIAELGHTIRGNEKVSRLHIPVNESPCVNVRQRPSSVTHTAHE